MIKTVLFDLGNVILPFDLMRLATKLAKFSPFPAEQILEKIAYTQVAEDFETGLMSSEDYYSFVSKGCEFQDLSYDDFISIFNDIFNEDTEVWELISRLKKNYKLGLISNTNPIHVAHIRSAYPQLSHFEQLWFSNEARVRKPHPSIYQMALSHFAAEPGETVFIDDYLDNVKGALRLGIVALHYTGVEKLRRDLFDLGVRH